MNKTISIIKEKYNQAGRGVFAFFTSPSNAQIQAMLFVLGITLLTVGIAKGVLAQDTIGNYNSDRFDEAVNRIFTYLEGSFGVLIMVCAGLGAILSSAFGQYRAALGCLVVAVGAFVLRSFASTFFNTEGIDGLNG